MTVRIHTINSAWAAASVAARPPEFEPGYARVPCSCGGSVMVLITGDDDQDIENLIDSFSQEHTPGAHEQIPPGGRPFRMGRTLRG